MAAGCMSMHSGPASQYFISSIAFFLKKNLSLYWICCYIASVLCREPAQAIPPRTRSCGRELLSKASGLEGLPRPARASTPKPESVCLTILCLSPTLLTLTGGYPRPPFSGENQLRALANKFLGHDRSISLWWLSSLSDRFIQTLAATHVIIHSLPTVRGTGSLKHRAFQRVKNY